ncbi:DNA-directed RNA polymerase II large subunit, putative [Babesia caballi]|uniref:DNA-directed RNA polymerase II large subunit, putative n=1 Tax=Babesia caballi TaxID=5871 RepID=A0AAV4M048_BABCB|nr:DNA-directed RNA polymerase II large subunit, putative [Babesia caballi]
MSGKTCLRSREWVEEKQPVAEELSDNEFDDAEVETAQHQERPVEGLESAGAVESTAPADTVPPEPVSTVDREAATDDVEDDISISDVSDLDDREPETKDLVIGRLEKVSGQCVHTTRCRSRGRAARRRVRQRGR